MATGSGSGCGPEPRPAQLANPAWVHAKDGLSDTVNIHGTDSHEVNRNLIGSATLTRYQVHTTHSRRSTIAHDVHAAVLFS